MKTKEQLRILLVQIRDDETTREEELNEFVRFSGLARTQFDTLNVFATPTFEPTVVDRYDALFVGGSSDANILKPEEFPFVPSTEWLMHYVIEKGIPTFASCYGFQAAVVALGGSVIRDKQNMEMGTYSIELTSAGDTDVLFRDTPTTFTAVSGHQLRADRLPDGVTLLGYSEKCPYHAFKVDDVPFWAFQFHPEVDREDLIARITRYKERYLDSDGALETIIQSAEETPESNVLVHKFVERVLCA